MPKIKYVILLLVSINILLSAYFLVHGDIHYDRDVARDFLVIDSIVRERNLTLLGPRSSIPGLFHGPLWFYINLPAFVIGGGNPLVIGWFWFLLSVVFLGIVFYTAQKLFDNKTALLSILLISVNSIINPSIGLKNFYNPYGAVFLTPIFFWLFYTYNDTLKIKYLIFSLLTLGFIIQFQIAFGVPILFAVTVFLFYFLFKKKKILHSLAYLILLVPLSTFILFDLRHDGLQIKSFLQDLHLKEGLSSNFSSIFTARTHELIFDFFDFLSPGKNVLTVIIAMLFFFAYIISLKKGGEKRKFYRLFGYLFLGFWISSVFHQGSVGNYFWPFLSITIIIFCSFYKFINKGIFILAFILLYLVNLQYGISAILDFKTDINKRGPHSWAFNLQVARKIYKDSREDFGYFTYSPDRFAYQQRYAFIYAKKLYPELHSFSSAKKPLTYLIEVDPPKDRPDLAAIFWRTSDIGIKRPPDQTFRFDFIQIEKYYLSSEETKVQANPLILDYMFVR